MTDAFWSEIDDLLLDYQQAGEISMHDLEQRAKEQGKHWSRNIGDTTMQKLIEQGWRSKRAINPKTGKIIKVVYKP